MIPWIDCEGIWKAKLEGQTRTGRRLRGGYDAGVADMNYGQKLGITLERSLPHLAPETRARVADLINPTSLAIMAGVLMAWVVSHAVGIGEAVDIVLGVVGAVSIGLAVFSGLDEFWSFAYGVRTARTPADLETAARHFAKAITILGIEAVLGLLFRGRPQIYRGKPLGIGAEPPRGPGDRYRPTTAGDASLPRGSGSTNPWGNITYSLRGSAEDRALVQAHERIHQILTPKLYRLRRVRVQSRTNSYFRSSLSRYLEEALAETAAQVQVRGGLANLIEGLRFPVLEGYVSLTRTGGYSSAMSGQGVLRELGGLIGTGSAAGMSLHVRYRHGALPAAAAQTSRQAPSR